MEKLRETHAPGERSAPGGAAEGGAACFADVLNSPQRFSGHKYFSSLLNPSLVLCPEHPHPEHLQRAIERYNAGRYMVLDKASGNDKFIAHDLHHHATAELVTSLPCMNHQLQLLFMGTMCACVTAQTFGDFFATFVFLKTGSHMLRIASSIHRYVSNTLDLRQGTPPPDDIMYAAELKMFLAALHRVEQPVMNNRRHQGRGMDTPASGSVASSPFSRFPPGRFCNIPQTYFEQVWSLDGGGQGAKESGRASPAKGRAAGMLT